VFSGGYTENAAHNPGLAPLQAAFAGAIIGGLCSYEEARAEGPAANARGGGGRGAPAARRGAAPGLCRACGAQLFPPAPLVNGWVATWDHGRHPLPPRWPHPPCLTTPPPAPSPQVEEVVVAELGKGLVRHAGVARTLARAATRNAKLPVTVLPLKWE
jgi:hypothetical protein